MSGADSKVLKEYLLSLGFRADPVSQKKFEGILGGIEGTVGRVGKGLLGVAAAAQGMVAAFTASAEKAYYASKLGATSVGNMQAAAYAGKQIGLTAEQVQGSITSLAMSLRQNPGLGALLESLGIKVEGRDMSDVLSDMVAEFRKLPFFIGADWAGEAGLDPQTYFLLAEGLDKYNAAQRDRKELAKAAKVDEEAFAEASVKYQNSLGVIAEKVSLLGKKLAIHLLPMFEKLNDIINRSLDFWTRWSDKLDGFIDKVQSVNDWLRKAASWNPLWRWMLNQVDPQPGVAPGANTQHRISGVVGDYKPGTASDFSTLSNLENKYGLPKGVLDYIWWTESRRGKRMLSSKGAKGDMGFMDDTAKDWGVDVKDKQSSFTGAARYLQYLMQHYDGDIAKALAAYNWGMGNVDKKGLGAAPNETRAYVRGWNGVEIGGPQTTIIVDGSGSPRETAETIKDVLDQRDADYQRNLTSVLQ